MAQIKLILTFTRPNEDIPFFNEFVNFDPKDQLHRFIKLHPKYNNSIKLSQELSKDKLTRKLEYIFDDEDGFVDCQLFQLDDLGDLLHTRDEYHATTKINFTIEKITL